MYKISELEEYQMVMDGRKVNILELFGYDIPKQNFPHNFDCEGGGGKGVESIQYVRDEVS